jgi:parallel beta-helix repeat protein
MKGKSSFALLLVCSLALLPAVPAMAVTAVTPSTYYVATTGNNANDGSLGAPWLTIQYAVDTVGSGDTIRVTAGTYTEQVTIQKSVNLIGAGRATTIIQAPSAPRTGKVVNFSRTWDYVLGAYATSGTIAVLIEGFTIDANGQDQSSGTTHFTGVFFRDVNGAGAGLYSSAIQNFGTGAVNYGVQIFGDSNLTVGYNTLTGYTRDGIDAWGNLGSAADPNVTISYNDLVGTPLQALNGIMLTDEATGTVSWNSVQDHTRNADWAATGVLLWGSNNVSVSHNTLTNCFDAIDVYLSDGSTIHGNVLAQTIKRGINLDTSNGNTVDENIIQGTLTGTEDVGIALVRSSNGNIIDGNAIALPTGGTGNLYSIHVQGDVGAGSNTISNNTIDGGKRSIPVDTGTSGTHTISGNIIGATTAPSWSGIELQSGNAFITGNTLIDAVRPIEMSGPGPHNVTISGNTFEGVAYNAINAGSYTGTIRVSDGNKFINISGPSLWNQGAAEIDATNNWWGDPSGPWHATDNPQGLGGSVVGNVNFGPWYIDASMTILSDELHLTVSVAGLGTVTKDPAPDINAHYSYGDVVTLTPVPAADYRFDRWTGSLTGSANPASLTFDGNETVTAVFDDPPPPPPGDLGPFEEESEDGVVVIEAPAGISENPVFLTIGDAENPPPTDGNPNLGAYDVELKDAKTGQAITELTKSITITFHFTAAMLAAAGVTDPHDLVIWYWDEDAEPAACWVALPTVVGEVAGAISATVDHLTTFIAMVDEDFPKLGDIAGHWAQTDILRLASYGAVNGFDDGTFRPEAGVTRAQFAKFIVATLGLTPGTALPVRFKDASDAQDWAVPYLAACLRDGIMTGADGLLRPNATITRAEAAAMVVRVLGLAAGGSGASAGGGGAPAITFADAASIPAWAATLVAEAVDHGLIEGLPGSIFSPAGTLTRAQAVTILSHAADLE